MTSGANTNNANHGGLNGGLSASYQLTGSGGAQFRCGNLFTSLTSDNNIIACIKLSNVHCPDLLFLLNRL